MKTRAAVLHGHDQPFSVEEIELEEPRPTEVLVRLVASGLCHSDLNIVEGKSPTESFPYICGHEGAGVVERVGEYVSRCAPGDHVVLSFIPSCGVCRWCTNGMSNLCDLGALIRVGVRPDGTARAHDRRGRPLRQFCQVATFSEHTLVDQASVVKVDASLPLSRACLVGCGVATGVGAAINRAKVQPGSSVVVFGCGGIGSNVIQGARLAGATPIVGVDLVDFKLEQARRFGATHTINARREDPIRRVQELTHGQGADYTFEAIGQPVTLGQAFDCAGKGGTTVGIGVSHWQTETIPINPSTLVLYQKALIGTLFGSSNPGSDIPRLLGLYQTGQLLLDELVTREYRLDEINQGYEDLLAGRNIRGVIRYD